MRSHDTRRTAEVKTPSASCVEFGQMECSRRVVQERRLEAVASE